VEGTVRNSITQAAGFAQEDLQKRPEIEEGKQGKKEGNSRKRKKGEKKVKKGIDKGARSW
jgi:hypothetical protein